MNIRDLEREAGMIRYLYRCLDCEKPCSITEYRKSTCCDANVTWITDEERRREERYG